LVSMEPAAAHSARSAMPGEIPSTRRKRRAAELTALLQTQLSDLVGPRIDRGRSQHACCGLRRLSRRAAASVSAWTEAESTLDHARFAEHTSAKIAPALLKGTGGLPTANQRLTGKEQPRWP